MGIRKTTDFLCNSCYGYRGHDLRLRAVKLGMRLRTPRRSPLTPTPCPLCPAAPRAPCRAQAAPERRSIEALVLERGERQALQRIPFPGIEAHQVDQLRGIARRAHRCQRARERIDLPQRHVLVDAPGRHPVGAGLEPDFEGFGVQSRPDAARPGPARSGLTGCRFRKQLFNFPEQRHQFRLYRVPDQRVVHQVVTVNKDVPKGNDL